MKPGPLILAALTALVLAVRWRQLPTQSRALAALAVIALAVWGSGVIHPPNLETVARDIGATLGAYTYALVGLLAFLETGAGIGLIAPGELAVVIGGVTAGQGHTNLVWLIGVVWACAVAGDIASYALGRRLGRPFLLKYGAPLKLTPQRLEQVEGFLRRHGRKTIIVGRFIGVVRALAPFTAGSTNMPARRFVPAVFVAAGIWAAAFTTLGYVFWQSFNEASALAKQGTFALLALVVLVVLLVAAYRNLRNPERRRRLRARLRTLPIAGRLRGQGSHQQGMNRLALSATTHCLTGCAIGEILGLAIGTAVGLSNGKTIVLAIVLAFLVGYTLTSLPLLRAGMPLTAVIPVALAADTISITVMEIVDNAIMLVIPGALNAGLGDPLFWAALAIALTVAGTAAFPPNKWLLRRGRGHAVLHAHHLPDPEAAQPQ
jgi:membrane protein DedA with SNARE-associated domain